MPELRDRVEAWLLLGLAVVALGAFALRGQPVPATDVVHPAPAGTTIGLLVLVGLLVLAVESVRAARFADPRFRAVRAPLVLALVSQIALVLFGAQPLVAGGAVVVGVVALAAAAGRLVRLEPARTLRTRLTLHGPVSLALGWTAALTPAAGELLGAGLGLGGGEASVLLAWAAVFTVAITGTWAVECVRAPLPFAVALVWGLVWILPGGSGWIVTPVLVAVLAIVWTLVRRLTRGGPPTWSGAFA
ncbi:hypothetical protein [Actinomycetospora corticicola]|uniref:Uncharacterized protein n=1 Tax=Actinomycetospora corticicola TaxID=663602 RepID=A0A7Y9J410_9PSEU|nr:hypothetical protein [Actinomycetospora corticicola]NYD34570.1 hypothetical protein [Actinomycetospora corticicola]